jgi:hypothetical protein
VDDGGDELEVNVDVETLVACDAAPATSVHWRTTCTSGSPLGPVTGVNVIVHVWVTGPATLHPRE